MTLSMRAQERVPLRDGWSFAPGAADARPEAGSYRAIAVPGTFEDALGAKFDGAGWYRRVLDLPSAGTRARAEFTAAATEATVYFNGEVAGAHLGGWTPFSVELRAPRGDGTDLLEVFLDEKVGHDTQGFHPIIQPHFGGLWQDVVLCLDRAPVLDRTSLLTFGDGAADELVVEASCLPGPGTDAGLALVVTVGDGAVVVARAATAIATDRPARLRLSVDDPRPWSPASPNLYRVVLELRSGEAVLDQVVRQVGFRDLRADGLRVLLDGAPLAVRGVLHWGYEPPLFAPNPDARVWRRELEDLRARGFNMVKACLWLPPASFYEVADQVGMLVWQEYPTWHPQLTKEHGPALEREFAEFYRHDRSHACVTFRSLTCETGHSADLGVITALYDRCKADVPQALVVDDSSWIEWLRVFDFYDDHPYGNNRWWPGKLAYFRQFIAAREAKPLLLGECIAADTWLDRQAWERAHGGEQPWFAPRCLEGQPRFEAELTEAFGTGALEGLLPGSLAYAMRMRKYQIERLRLDLPHAGYTVSVLRDFTLARMGLYDDFGAMKWSEAEWGWQGDTMLCLDAAGDARGFVGRAMLPVRVVHAGRGTARGSLTVACDELAARVQERVAVEPDAVSEPVTLELHRDVDRPMRVRVAAELRGETTARNAWDVWLLPRPAPVDPGEVRSVDALDADTLRFLQGGGRVLLRAGERARSLKTQAIWFLRGACFVPPHPVHARVPAELLGELQTFDLESGRVLQWDNLKGQVDPILAFWESHDIPDVRAHLFAFDCRVGAGRLLATVLDHDTPAGQWVLGEFVRHLREGPAPQRALSEATVATLAAFLAADVLPLPAWELRTDPNDEGLRAGFAAGDEPATGWKTVTTRAHWESQGFPHYDGVAWYRVRVDVPATWRGKVATAVFEGVDDSFRLYVNGVEVARFGDPATKHTVWLERVTADVTQALRPGQPNSIVLRVVDHAGAGGIWKPVFLTTGPADARCDLLH